MSGEEGFRYMSGDEGDVWAEEHPELCEQGVSGGPGKWCNKRADGNPCTLRTGHAGRLHVTFHGTGIRKRGQNIVTWFV